jgi:hypothetical protein
MAVFLHSTHKLLRSTYVTDWWDGGMAEWRNGGMVFYYDTYLIYPAIFMVHTDDANKANDTNGF